MSAPLASESSPAIPARPTNRALAIALAVAAAGCLVFASWSKQWLVNGNAFEHYGFGLRTNVTCNGEDGCSEETNSSYVETMRQFGPAAQNVSGVFAPLGWATFVECLAAAAGLLAAAAIAAARKTPSWPIAPTTISLLGSMAGLVTGCVFVATKPGQAGFVGVGLGFWLFGAGAVLGLGSSLLLARVNRPADPDLLEDAMQPDQF